MTADPSTVQDAQGPGVPHRPGPLSLAALRRRLRREGPGAHRRWIEQQLLAAQAPAASQAFTVLLPHDARAAADAADAACAAGAPLPPLAGLPVTVKDLYDIAGRTTLAGSVVRTGCPPATEDAAAVARLRRAGAALLGLTQMTEFAFSGVGLNPHTGTPRNPADPQVARIPGGSSSGAAVSVALGLAVGALGSDTGGSIRVPAALCGLVGFKCTQRRTPRAGAFPLSHTLDTVCAMAATVRDALELDGVLAAAPLRLPARGLRGARLALPGSLVLDGLEPAVARAFERALSRLSAAGAQVIGLPLGELAEIGEINAPGGLSAIEAWATHRHDMERQRERFDPRVAARIALGQGVSAAEYQVLLQRRQDWILRVTHRLQGFDALICPTVPLLAPEVDRLRDDDAAFFRTNGLLLRNTFVANFLDGCSFSLPCHEAGELPVGLMLTAPGGQDAALAALAVEVEAALAAAAPR